uniref:Amine oxidase domain-containing protein n=1 Tax=Sinocyclocheilus grahami TaxID=75366 RepID=A0A672KKI0_SINGR
MVLSFRSGVFSCQEPLVAKGINVEHLAQLYHHRCNFPKNIVLLERSGRCGGWLSSIRRDDGAVFEQGQRGVRPAGAVGRNTLNMVCSMLTNHTLLDRATRAVTSHLGVNSQPVWSYVALLKNCIPQYHLGHWKRLEKMRQYISNHNLPLTLAGASYDGVSVSDVIFSRRTAAEGLIGKHDLH